MKHINLFILLLLVQFSLLGQNTLNAYIRSNTVSIENSNSEYDFHEIAKSIKDKRFVFLGEQHHGDLTTFQLKSKLVKYLHDSLGYNILAFEGDFFALNYQNDTINFDSRDLRFYKYNIMPVWSECSFFDKFVNEEFINQSLEKPKLKLVGFDCQPSGALTYKLMPHYLKGVIQNYNIDKKMFLDKLNSLMDSLFWTYRMDSNQCYRLINFCDEIIDSIGMGNIQRFDLLNILNIKHRGESLLLRYQRSDYESNVRDIRMAENLKYLTSERYKNEKFIIWAHTLHVIDLPESRKDGHKWKNMAQYFFDDSLMKAQSHIIIFTSKKGHFALIEDPVLEIKNCEKKSFEDFVPNKIKFGFIDFGKYNKDPKTPEKFVFRGIIHKCYEMKFKGAFDGLIYIKTMYPCSNFEK
jgi:erythromycin esterase